MRLKYCPNCGSDQLTDRIPETEDRLRQVCDNCEHIHYSNPRVIVGCLVINDGKVLLAKRNIEPRKGLWNLPCGFLEDDETVMDGAVRETYEECLAKVKADHLHCIYDLVGFHQVYLIFRAHMLEDGIGVTAESSEVAFLSPEEIPWDEIAFGSTRFALEKWIEEKEGADQKLHFGKISKFAEPKNRDK